MNYNETIDYLFSRLPMFSRIGSAAIKNDLTNTIELCAFLNNPQHTFKSIHIAGTNGKGSVSHMLASVFQTAGYKTGLYTSPHLKDFRERIKINGKLISKKFVTDFTQKIQPLIDKINPSFFEITVAMAFEYFAEEKVDIAIIETGLGGRLDSTNVLIPELSVITNIGWDHMNLLGDSLEKIAAEKAGIIKTGIPVVIGEYNHETKNVFENIASERQSSLIPATEERKVINRQWKNNELIVKVSSGSQSHYKIFHLDLPGIYQTKNILTVLAACSEMQKKGWQLNEEDIKKGLKNTRKLTGLHGRWEIVQQNPLIILDVAHNTDGIQQLLQQIELTPHNGLHIILGMVKDKEIEKVLDLLPVYATYYFTQAHIPRAIDANQLKEKAATKGLKGLLYPDVNNAILTARENAKQDDMIVVCGSVFLVGEVNR